MNDKTRSISGESAFWQTGLDDIRVMALAVVAVVSLIYTLPALISPFWLVLPLGACLVLRFPGRLLVLVCCLAAVWTLYDAGQRMAARLPVGAHGETVWVTGQVSGLPERSAYRTRFLLDTQRMGRLRLSWYHDTPSFLPGDCLRLRVKLSTPHGSANPGGFDYTAWLWREGIDATGYVKAAEACARAPTLTLDRLRARAMQRLVPALADQPMRGIVEALSLGIRQHISDAQWAVLRATGTSHLVAISGLHIGLVAGLAFMLVQWLALRSVWFRSARRWACLAGALCACGYAGLAGWALPTQRALVMVGVGLWAIAVEREIGASRALALAALLVVAIDPAAVSVPGFWLSFAAVAWLIWIATTARGPRWMKWLAFQFGLMAALAPVTLWFFGQTSLIAPLVNALLIPASVVFVPIVLAGVLLTVIWPPLGTPILARIAEALGLGWQGLAALAHDPSVMLTAVLATPWVVVLATAGLVGLALPVSWRLRGVAAVMLLPLVLGYRGSAPQPMAGGFRATVLDVGQGLSVVVQTRRHTLVFDAGPAYPSGFDAGQMIVVPYLRAQGATHVDRMMISHGDMDHIGGAKAIEAALDVQERLGAGSPRSCRAGQHWRWDGVDFTVLYPSARQAATADNDNDRSCVLRVRGETGTLLLTGDIQARGERALRDAWPGEGLAADVLVIPHHGSRTSSSALLLEAVHPRLAVVSTGWHNRWHFPRPSVIARYSARHIPVLDTANSGAVTLVFEQPGPPVVSRWRVRHARFWQQPLP